MKKRLIGVAVLVVIGVVTPLLLSQCLHGDDAGDGSMRVYNVTPSGDTQSSAQASQTGDKSESAQQAKSGEPAPPEAVSPQDESSDEPFSTPAVSGGGHTDDSTGQHDSASEASGQSESAQSDTNDDTADHPDADSSSSESTESSPSGGQAQRNDSASGWVVQVASVRKLSNAKALVKDLSSDYRASYAKAEVNGKTWYRVNVGPFADEDAARSSAASLKKRGRNPLVRHLP